MTIRSIRPVACERPTYTREARTRQSEAQGAIEHLGEEFAQEITPLMGRVSVGDIASHLSRKIQGVGSMTLLKKGIATSIVNHIVPKLHWVERGSSINGLLEISLASLEKVTEACGYKRNMNEQEKTRFSSVREARDALHFTENPAEAKEFGSYYKDSIASNMGYTSFKDLKKQTLRSVAKHAGDFVTKDRPANVFSRIFQALYKAIFGVAAKYAVDSQFSKIGAIASKYYMKLVDDQTHGPALKAESEVFAYCALQSLMEERHLILSEHEDDIADADLQGALMEWLNPEQIDQ